MRMTGFPLFVDADLGAVLVPARVEDALSIEPPVGVRAEVVAEPLDEVARPALAAQSVVVGERGGEGGHRDAEVDGVADHPPPGLLPAGEGVAEEGREHQVAQVRVILVRLADAVEEARTDDAAAAPDGG